MRPRIRPDGEKGDWTIIQDFGTKLNLDRSAVRDFVKTVAPELIAAIK